jgi:hypothetical protein
MPAVHCGDACVEDERTWAALVHMAHVWFRLAEEHVNETDIQCRFLFLHHLAEVEADRKRSRLE